MEYKEGKSYYFYDNRAIDDVCKAHVLHVLPHPEDKTNTLIVYRWYGMHKQWWWYGITSMKEQLLWSDYVKKVISRRRKKKGEK